MGPQVTVIVPAFNSAETIARSVNSVLRQSFHDFELIVVDDGSTDQTTRRLEKISDSRLKIVRHDRNRGAAAARNTGISKAGGRWIAFLDADDEWRQEKLERQIARLEGQPEIVKACATGYCLHKEKRKSLVRLDLTAARFKEDVLFGCTISPGSTLLVASDAFGRVGLFDEELRRLEDWDWLLRFSEHYDVTFVPEPLVDIYTLMPEGPAAATRYSMVKNALDRLEQKNRLRFPSGVKRRQFLSSIFVEKAAALYNSGKNYAAIVNVLISLSIYPNRNVAFFKTLWRSFLSRRAT